MPIPDISEITLTARKIVLKAKKEGKLSVLTPRIVRQEVERLLEIEQRTLDEKEYKVAVKSAVEAAIGEEDKSASEEDSKISDNDKPVKKRRSGGEKRSSKLSKKQKTVKTSRVEEDASDAIAEKALRSSNKEEKKYKSAAAIQSSDDDDVHPQSGKKKPLSKKTAKAIEREDDLSNRRRQSDTTPKDENLLPSHPSASSLPNSGSVIAVKSEDIGYRSESEMSVLIDEPPKRGKKSQAKEKTKQPDKQKKEKKPVVELSKDEETIKRLKSLVFACGVRKVWSKEFQNLDKPSQQIKRLKTVLGELGMTGRLSLEQAKAIKEKRELAQELEDVKQFAKTVAGQSSRARTKDKKNRASPSHDESEDEAESESDAAPTKKQRNTARRSIMAFLGDQSDDE